MCSARATASRHQDELTFDFGAYTHVTLLPSTVQTSRGDRAHDVSTGMLHRSCDEVTSTV